MAQKIQGECVFTREKKRRIKFKMSIIFHMFITFFCSYIIYDFMFITFPYVHTFFCFYIYMYLYIYVLIN